MLEKYRGCGERLGREGASHGGRPMAWRTTRLRNTQSSTGILYVMVVFVCVGELTAQLLLNETGYFL